MGNEEKGENGSGFQIGTVDLSSDEIRERLKPYLTCELLDQKFMAWGIYPNVTARDIGCVSVLFNYPQPGDNRYSGENNSRTAVSAQLQYFPRKFHLYGCMQMVKKLHPIFDKVLLGILRADPTAKIILMERAVNIVPRLLQYSVSEGELFDRLLFVRRQTHAEYLMLTSLTSVFLNSFPYGAGVTSSEAIAMCIPVLALPDETSV